MHHRVVTRTCDEVWETRLRRPKEGWFDAESRLEHFAVITYAVPKSRLEVHIPTDLFDIPEFDIDGRPQALLSAVPFVDADFHFLSIFPFAHFRFGQTNHRVYVIHRQTGEHCVWFFGTTLGSPVVAIPRTLWRIPWHRGHYAVDCLYDQQRRKYDRFRFTIESRWCAAEVDIEDTGDPVTTAPGFPDAEEAALILTHPLDGYFRGLDGKLGTYSVWHDRLACTYGRANNVYFSLYENLGILSRAEMLQPHSILLCPETDFLIRLPPRPLFFP